MSRLDRLRRSALWLRERPAATATAIGVLFLLAPGLAVLRPALPGAQPRSAPAPAPSEQAAAAGAAPAVAARAPAADWFQAQAGAAGPAAASKSSHDCLLQPSDRVSVGSPITGRIQRITVERADDVEAGQIVAELESDVERAGVEVAEARAAMNGPLHSRTASAELERNRGARARQLYASNVLSLEMREEVETQAEVAAAELGQAREEKRLAALELKQAAANLERRVIRSPIPGVVTERLLSPGEVVDEETILRIARIDPLWVETLLPAAEFGSIQRGMRAVVTPEGPGDHVHVALVTLVDRVVDPASGTFTVRLALPNPGHQIPSGLNCQVRFLAEDEAPPAATEN